MFFFSTEAHKFHEVHKRKDDDEDSIYLGDKIALQFDRVHTKRTLKANQ